MHFTWYPQEVTKEIRQRIRNKSRTYYAKERRLCLKESTDIPIEVLHAANVVDTVNKIHKKDTSASETRS
jgi:hypothetical protein